MRTESARSAVPVWLIPNITVFCSSACIMIVELVASKLIARHVGMSLYTWTSIIGIIMAGISIGNFLGGRLADRYRTGPTLAALFMAAAVACISVLPLNWLSGGFAPFLTVPWPARVFIHVTLVFFVPAMMLGMINPVVAKLALDFKRSEGRTLGGVFAWAVAGSLVGTFLTGFYLVMVLGVATIILMAASGLALLGLLYFGASVLGKGGILPMPATAPQQAEHDATGIMAAFAIWAPAAITVFISNAAFMTFELAVMRVVAREFGGSLYTWTTVIGIVLAGISLGNYLGGRLADRWTAKPLIAVIFCVSAVAVAFSPAFHARMSDWREHVWHLASLSWPMQTLVHVAFVGFIPCVFIGMVSPVVTRRLLQQGNAPGASVGAVYAWGSIGAIAGTFLTGYVLIQWLGSIPVIATVALLLAFVGLAYAPGRIWSVATVCFCIIACGMALLSPAILHTLSVRVGYSSPENPRRVFEDESQYAYIAIIEDEEEPAVREMFLDRLVHTRIDMRDPTRLLYEYEWVYSAVMEKKTPLPEPVRAFVIGGGGYAYPHYLELMRPDSDIVVAEIDPAVTEAAHVALGLPRDTDMTIHHLDARNVVIDMLRAKQTDPDFQRFDFIFGDSINDYTVPYHLTTVEFKEAVSELLTDDGVYLFNMIDMFDSGAFLAAIVNTCRHVFPTVAVFSCGRPTFMHDTFVVVGAKQPLTLDDIEETLQSTYEFFGEKIADETLDELIERNNNILLTDQFAPVENLLAPVVRTRATNIGILRLSFAMRHANQNEFNRALGHVYAAIESHPDWSYAYEVLSEILFMKGDIDNGIEALAAAIKNHVNPVVGWTNLANALTEVGRTDEAINAWRQCAALAPENVRAFYNMGVLYANKNQIANAIAAWTRVIDIEPDHVDSRYNLAVAYLMQGNTEEAQEMVASILTLGHDVDQELLNNVGLGN